MRKLKDWIYKFDSYNLWIYKNGEMYMTKDYCAFGKKRQSNIKVGSETYFAIMSLEEVIWHENLS
jgi:hypothetical protein